MSCGQRCGQAVGVSLRFGGVLCEVARIPLWSEERAKNAQRFSAMPRGKRHDEHQIEIDFPGVPVPITEPALPKPTRKRRSPVKAKRRPAKPRRRPQPRPLVIYAPI